MLNIVATPIGNLEDMTYRSVDILKNSDYIFAEDTRNTKKLLDHYNINTITYSYHSHSEDKSLNKIIRLLKKNKKVSLVSDAGTPCISDPGYVLVQRALENNIKVRSIPGASALTAAASVSGIDMRRFAFEGFLPKKQGRETILNGLRSEKRAIIIFESPYRLRETLKELKEYLGDRIVAVNREISKIYEEVIRGKISEVLEKLDNNVKGEIVLVIAPKGD
ncbi:MAG: 16S rRNA (cytidine(1402)-2'-O)-methyltransferase [Fusobacteriota bacterium]